MKALLGVWLVRGNWEHWTISDQDEKFYLDLKINFLNNQNQKIRSGITLVGVDDSWTGKPDIALAIKNIFSKDYRIAILHSLDFFKESSHFFDLALAGHTHGGQVRFPFYLHFGYLKDPVSMLRDSMREKRRVKCM